MLLQAVAGTVPAESESDAMANLGRIVDTYADGEATVTTFACDCEEVDAPTYTAWFPCSEEHAALVSGRIAA